MTADDSLRACAQQRGILVGAAAAPRWIADDPQYANILAREFNCLTAENCMKFQYLQPDPGRFDFLEADRLVDFATRHEQRMRGHTLVWHNQVAGWARTALQDASPEAARDLMRSHITTVVKHFRESVFCWDVVNEALADDGTWREKSPWFQSIGPGYVADAFRTAHAADPDALLFYNDYGVEQPGAKTDAAWTLLRDMIDQGIPVHGVGLQYHLGSENRLDPEALARVIQQYADLGLTVHLTEVDMGIPTPVTPEKRRAQAEEYATRLRAALSSPAVTAIVFWGFCDRYTWIPSFTKGTHDEPLLFDREYRPKPAYEAVRTALRSG